MSDLEKKTEKMEKWNEWKLGVLALRMLLVILLRFGLFFVTILIFFSSPITLVRMTKEQHPVSSRCLLFLPRVELSSCCILLQIVKGDIGCC